MTKKIDTDEKSRNSKGSDDNDSDDSYNIMGDSEDSIDAEIRQRRKEGKKNGPILEVEKDMLRDKARLRPEEKQKLKDIV